MPTDRRPLSDPQHRAATPADKRTGVARATLAAALLATTLLAQGPTGDPGERVPAAAIGPLLIEDLAAVQRREQRWPPIANLGAKTWHGQDGVWYVPPPHAGSPATATGGLLINRWGDPRMGIGLGARCDLRSVWIAGYGATPARAVRFVGWRDGAVVHTTPWLQIDVDGAHLPLDIADIDRVEIEADPGGAAQAWYALDDLRLRRSQDADPAATERRIDFDDLPPRTTLTGSDHAGLAWEFGSGLRRVDPERVLAIEAPQRPGDQPGSDLTSRLAGSPGALASSSGIGTPPVLGTGFAGDALGGAGGGFIPPDSCLAAGPHHVVALTNSSLSVFDRDTGARQVEVGLTAFWNSTASVIGDPRVLFDPHSRRFVAAGMDGPQNQRIYVAISGSDDPTGTWTKWWIHAGQGADAGRWPDYPTLGVDARGIYTAALMVGPPDRMTIWAIDKAPLLAPNPQVGTVTAWRDLPWEGAIQPCITFGDPGSEFLVSRIGNILMRLREITPPLTAPTLVNTAAVYVPNQSRPPAAPALGSATPLGTGDFRPMNAVFRAGSVWMTHGVDVGGQAGVRWYEIDTSTRRPLQIGTISDPLFHYFFPSIAVDARGDVALGFSGSHAGVWAGAFVSGRLADDAPGVTSDPQLVRPGLGPYQRLDGNGNNRWGDYSLTVVDPVDDLGFWTVQEYAGTNNSWQTWIQRLGYPYLDYGDGTPGAAGTPTLAPRDWPRIGQSWIVEMLSSTTGPTNGVLALGVSRTALPLLGGTLLAQPAITLPVGLPVSRTPIRLQLPADPALLTNPIHLQLLVIDAAAPQGLAFSRGLELRAVTR